MKNQLLKTMSVPLVTLLIVFAGSLVSANAQSNQPLYAQVPFNFVVGDKAMSAGKYSVSPQTQDGSALLIRSIKTKESAIRLTGRIQARSNKTNSRLVFHRYGQTYFLAEVWQTGESTGRVLHASKAERELQKERSLIGQNSYETVELVASIR
jgi:hypothetical protein